MAFGGIFFWIAVVIKLTAPRLRSVPQQSQVGAVEIIMTVKLQTSKGAPFRIHHSVPALLFGRVGLSCNPSGREGFKKSSRPKKY